MRQSGLIAALPEPVPETCRTEGLAIVGDREALNPDHGRGGDGHGQRLGDRDVYFGTGLGLRKGQPPVAHMSGTKGDHMSAALRCVEQQIERYTRLGADRVASLVLSKLVLAPAVIAAGLDRVELDAERWIIAPQFLINREGEQHTQHAGFVAPMACLPSPQSSPRYAAVQAASTKPCAASADTRFLRRSSVA
jgi:hypothetical protein